MDDEPLLRNHSMRMIDIAVRLVFGLLGLMLIVLAGGLLCVAAIGVASALIEREADIGSAILNAIGYTVIAIAVFDVAKYLLEEDVIRAREMGEAGESRRSMTKFVTTIAIAVFLEALVTIFEASRTDLRLMLYPTFLLLGGVAMVIGLGIYQRMSARVERDVDEPPVSGETIKPK